MAELTYHKLVTLVNRFILFYFVTYLLRERRYLRLGDAFTTYEVCNLHQVSIKITSIFKTMLLMKRNINSGEYTDESLDLFISFHFISRSVEIVR